MFQSPHQWDVLVDARIEDLHAMRRSRPAPALPGRLGSIFAAARRPVGRALISAGIRIAGLDGATGTGPRTQPPAPARYAV